MTVVIVGGGVMGLSAAFHLRRADPTVPVTVLERARVGAAASGASAAGVRVMGRHPAERALALESLARWRELDRELEGETRYRRDGGLRVALDDGPWRAAPAWVAEQRAAGVPVEVVDETAARKIAPGSRRIVSAACTVRSTARRRRCRRRWRSPPRRRLGARVEGGGDTECDRRAWPRCRRRARRRHS